MKTLNELSDFLIQERKSRQLSQKDMRMLIGMSQQQYQRVESGQDLKVSTLLRILSGLSMELTVVDPAANQKTQQPHCRQTPKVFGLANINT
ncbi:helix-turn-helix domain-containing protein [Psychrosphaera algicola]|uniref:Helix-turn-helix transcriptional regulator n=1 Tax=Psychrosphaera algicola TaxID=3023714 RepID=A0ABT5FIM8_9GAMM|nr:helix-turn-helix transcriptional regulator [Psychrosphaera sp. G1-22]MDC2891039.1 helix-turn-helix transcriptional regulator [Psychrosphaera sp. G1-22]